MKKTLFIAISFIAFCTGCKKTHDNPELPQPGFQSSALITDWTGLQFRLIKNTTGVTHVAYSRHFSYTGIALYESLVYGSSKKQSIAASLNGTVTLPAPAPGSHTFFPLAANAVFADMFRFFYASKDQNLFLIDSLEKVYKDKYIAAAKNNFDTDASIQYGQNIAAAVIEWSKLDNSANASIPYTAKGEGYWEPTPPAFTAPAVPGWGDNKTVLKGSHDNATVPAPPAFSKDAGSAFYNMAKEVYNVSQTLTDEQKAIANFWDDAPNGKYITAFGHWFSILEQVLEKEHTPLMTGAEAYMRLGVTMNESSISCWKSKYTFHQMRPVTYIRNYMGHGDWNSLITTPAHPEYLAAHATISGSAAYALESVFGSNYAFADHTYEDIGMAVRNYNSIEAAGTEAGMSRLYGGIHYRPSIDAGKAQGIKIAENVKNILHTQK